MQCVVSRGVSTDADMAVGQRRTKLGQIVEAFGVDNQAIQGIAYTDAACFGIVDNGCSLLQVTFFIEVSVADACAGLNNRDCSILADELDEIAATAGD